MRRSFGRRSVRSVREFGAVEVRMAPSTSSDPAITPVTLERLLEEVRPLCEPIAGGPPAGRDATADPRYEIVRRESEKVDVATHAVPDWGAVIASGEALLRETSKDLLVAAYIAFASFRVDGFAGLARGALLVAELMERFWEGLFPDLRRPIRRANAVEWFAARADRWLAETPCGEGDGAILRVLAAAMARLCEALRRRTLTGAEGHARASMRRVAAMIHALKPPPLDPDLSGLDAESLDDYAREARRWVAPIRAPPRLGVDASRVRSEATAIVRLAPEALAGTKVGGILLDETYLAEVSKDLTVGVAIVSSWGGLERLQGFAWSFAALVGMIQAHWATMTPPPAAYEKRAANLRWLARWAVWLLDNTGGLDPEVRARSAWAFGVLRVASRTLDAIARTWLDEPQLCGELLDAIEGLRWRASIAAPRGGHELRQCADALSMRNARIVSAWSVPEDGVPLQGDRTRGVADLAFLPDGKRFVSAGADGSVRLWDVAAESVAWTWRGGSGGPPSAVSVATSPDGARVLVGVDHAVVHLDASTGSVLGSWELREPTADAATSPSVRELAVSPDGTRALVLSVLGEQRHVSGWLLATGRKLGSLSAPAGETARGQVGFARGGAWAVHTTAATIDVWDVSSGAEIGHFPGPEASPLVASMLLGDGRKALSLLGRCGGVGPVLWELDTARMIWESGQGWRFDRTFAVSPDGCLLATVTAGTLVALWDLSEGRQGTRERVTLALRKGVGAVTRLAFAPDGASLLVGTAEGVLLRVHVRPPQGGMTR